MIYVIENRDGSALDARILWPARDEAHAELIRSSLVARRRLRGGPNGPIDSIEVEIDPPRRVAGAATTIASSSDVEELLREVVS